MRLFTPRLYPTRYKTPANDYLRGMERARPTKIAAYVKAMRKRYGLTQVDLSEKSGVGLRFVRELEQGKPTLRLDKVNRILNMFGSEAGPVPMTRVEDDDE